VPEMDITHCISYSNGNTVQSRLKDAIDTFCKYLCEEVLEGARPKSIDSRASEFCIQCQTEWWTSFIEDVLVATPCPDETNESNLKNYLV
jgi:hypothetical protein